MPADYSCDASGTQDMIKRLYALKLEEARTPQDATAQLMDRYNQQRNPDLKATLNGINSKSVDIDGVRLSDIRQISGPVDGEDGPYECAAQVTATWPQSDADRAHEVTDKLAVVGIEVDGAAVGHALDYRSSLEDDGARQAVEIKMPMLRQMLLEQLVAPDPHG